MQARYLAGLAICLSTEAIFAQSLSLDFTDPAWTNDSTGQSSEFQTNGSTTGNDAGWDSTHSIASINGSSIGATLSINHQVYAWNIENRPALAPYFPSKFGSAGDILRSWNNPAALQPGQIPSFTLVFSESIELNSFGLEGFRADDAWRVTAYDDEGNAVAPNWKDPNLVTVTNPGARLGNTAINILSTTGVNGTTGAEALGAGRYDATSSSFTVWNPGNVHERGAAILDYNGSRVRSVIYEMIEVDPLTGEYAGTPADQSMYLGSGLIFQPSSPVPEPGAAGLLLIGAIALIRRRR